MIRDRQIALSDVGVTFASGQAVLRDVNLQCKHGEFVAVIGPSGCGKSTLLRCIADLQSPTSGEVKVQGLTDSAPRIAYVFQESTLLPWRSAEKNVSLPLELTSVPKKARSSRVSAALQLAGLRVSDHGKRPTQLSGGMQMRVSLARAVVTEPELLLLDEPFAAIDDISRQQLNSELQRLWMEQGWTAMFVTHNVAEAVFLSQRVIVMSQNPGTIMSEFSVGFEFPRPVSLRTSPEFARLCGDLTEALEQASQGGPR